MVPVRVCVTAFVCVLRLCHGCAEKQHQNTQTKQNMGSQGMDVTTMIQRLMADNVKQWTDTRTARTSISSQLAHDPAFVRMRPGVYALKALLTDEVRWCGCRVVMVVCHVGVKPQPSSGRPCTKHMVKAEKCIHRTRTPTPYPPLLHPGNCKSACGPAGGCRSQIIQKGSCIGRAAAKPC